MRRWNRLRKTYGRLVSDRCRWWRMICNPLKRTVIIRRRRLLAGVKDASALAFLSHGL
ncbi:hypothetical protein HanXRQr2_Chr15g0694341 [Helianthus annuus]|uniref:Uncharacterized protein n=1 Tax=Helianthus annuus TaxID=4232 RepID=A0A9K3H4M5_HELAN|nr:hypothetical protein HanXRQr2_Chr15g0694341 [Helianthus annuus]KAJ0831369.1 hypothetical protein HanPSC8_Chr15g0666261 [Helianthus annuus]